MPIRWGDVDEAKIVYYPRFLHLCHVAMEETFAKVVKRPYPNVLHDDLLGFPAVRIECEFPARVEFGDVLRMHVRVARLGRTSITFAFDGRRARDGVSGLHALITTVCVDMRTFRPVPIPLRYRAALRTLVPGTVVRQPSDRTTVPGTSVRRQGQQPEPGA